VSARRTRRRDSQLRRIPAASDRHRFYNLDRRSLAACGCKCDATTTATWQPTDRSGLCHLHLRLHRQAERHCHQPEQHLPFPAQRKCGTRGAAERPRIPGLFASIRYVVRGNLDQLSRRRNLVDCAARIECGPRSVAARVGAQPSHCAARGADSVGLVQRRSADVAFDQSGRRSLPGNPGGSLVTARSPDFQYLRANRSDGIGQSCGIEAGRSRNHRQAA